MFRRAEQLSQKWLFVMIIYTSCSAEHGYPYGSQLAASCSAVNYLRSSCNENFGKHNDIQNGNLSTTFAQALHVEIPRPECEQVTRYNLPMLTPSLPLPHQVFIEAISVHRCLQLVELDL